jgi:hypothetical protein
MRYDVEAQLLLLIQLSLAAGSFRALIKEGVSWQRYWLPAAPVFLDRTEQVL